MDSVGEELERLVGLYERGDLTGAEFETLKAHLLNAPDTVFLESESRAELGETSTEPVGGPLEGFETAVTEEETRPSESESEVRRRAAALSELPPLSAPRQSGFGGRHLMAIVAIGVAVVVAIVFIQRGGEDEEKWPGYNPYCEAADGCYEDQRAPSSDNSRRTTTTQRYVTHVECRQGYGDFTKVYHWSDGRTTSEYGLAYC